jgi:hypothetical protein
MRVLGYFVGLGIAAVYAKAHMDLAEDTFTVYFKYFAVAEILAALFSFIDLIVRHWVGRLSVVFRRSTGGPRGVA